MTTQTKAILSFILYTLFLPFLISVGLYFMLSVSLLWSLLTTISLSIVIDKIIDKVINAKRLADFTDRYSKLPYKTFMTQLQCQACGHTNITSIDLTDNTEFVCASCHRKNAIYTTFTTAIAAKHEKL